MNSETNVPDGLEIDFNGTDADGDFLDARLEDYNKQASGRDDERPFCIVMRNGVGEVVGGIKGLTVMDWMYVGTLWISESQRGTGIGSQLLENAEKIAIERGCLGACLTSFGFQAPEFYEKHGYARIGQIDDYPPGDALYFLSRRFDSGDD